MGLTNQQTIDTISDDFRREVADGLLYAHSRLNSNTSKALETASFLYALVELLSEKGVISIEELDTRKKNVGQRLAKEFQAKAMGALLQEPEYDKYNFKKTAAVDCRERINLCHGACCRIPFALSKQDIREGIVRWQLGQPYLIAHGKDGYCEHLDRKTFGCSLYASRPVPCRAFDCRQDNRIWMDFENMIVNPDIHRDDWPKCLARKMDPDGG